jgi:alginate O-acetyltransferase complex protein AlgI
MVFSSPIFLFLFLPAVLACTALPGLKLRNLLLLAFSLVIYAWGEVIYGTPMRAAFFRCRHRTGR